MMQKPPIADDSFTGLILLSGIDKPGITEALFECLSPFSVSIIDIEQVTIRERLILTALISLDPNHSQSIEQDLITCATELNVDIAVSFSQVAQESIAVKAGLLHVVALGNPLKPIAIAAIAGVLAERNANIERIFRTASYPVTAVEFVVSGAPVREIRRALAHLTIEHGIDIAVQPGGLMRFAKKLVLMDVDSTLIQQEVIELLGVHAGAGEKIKEITSRAMAGQIDFEQSLRERVALLAGLPEETLAQVRSEIVLTPGARTLVRTLQRLGHTVAVVSGGFLQVIEPLMHELGIENYRANTLEIIDKKITGRLTGPVIDRAAKATALRDFAQIVNVDIEQTIAIGDGANDLDMIAAAGLGIAFNAKPAVRALADSAVSQPYLDSVLYLMGIAREDIEEADNQSLQA